VNKAHPLISPLVVRLLNLKKRSFSSFWRR